jgi:galactokinase/galacturonokinase
MIRARIAAEVEALAAAGAREAHIRTIVSPYRICPLGAHVDHQGGAMLGMAISAGTLLTHAPAIDGSVRLQSADYPGAVAFDAANPGPLRGDWGDYARGAALVLAPFLGPRPRGFVGRVCGTLPASGLSSSASVTLAYLAALARLNDIELRERQLVELARAVENDHLRVRCGVLDPVTIVGARRDVLLHIETRPLQWQAVALGAGAPAHRFLVIWSGMDRALAKTGFNDRVEECCAAAAALARAAGLPPAARIGDLPPETVARHLGSLPAALQRRARHFTGEVARVAAGVDCWRRGDLAAFGRLMHESGRSSIELYECGTPEIIELLAIVRDTEGVWGSRFSGAGFGGCCIALVDADAAQAASASILERFARAQPQLAARASAFAVESVDGLR